MLVSLLVSKDGAGYLSTNMSVFRYAPIRTPARKLMSTPTPYGGTPMYQIPEEERSQQFDVPKELEGLPELKPEDQQYFGKLLKEVSWLRTLCFAPV